MYGPLTGVEVLDETEPRALEPTLAGSTARPAVKARLRINLSSETIERVVGRNLKTLRGVAENMVPPTPAPARLSGARRRRGCARSRGPPTWAAWGCGRVACAQVDEVRTPGRLGVHGLREVSAAWLAATLDEQLEQNAVDWYNDE